MINAKNGIVVLYNIFEKYKLNTPIPYILGNIITYTDVFVFKDWVFIGHLCVVMFLDTILGVLVAFKKKEFSSRGLGRVFTKIAVYFLVLVATHNAGDYFVSTGLDFIVKVFDSTVYAAIILREYLSLIEKMPALGIWNPPEWLFKRMKIWYETGKIETKETNEQENPPPASQS